jgi:heme A synthase
LKSAIDAGEHLENTMSLDLPESTKFWLNFLHPILMWLLFALVLYALYTGIQTKRTRTAEGETKKELVQGKFRIKHYQIGSIMLAGMVLGTIGGMAVTYINNSKLFVGPHLLVGLSMTALVAISAALAPFMQNGNTTARFTHIGLNISLLGLFGWQAITGMDIVQRILDR